MQQIQQTKAGNGVSVTIESVVVDQEQVTFFYVAVAGECRCPLVRFGRTTPEEPDLLDFGNANIVNNTLTRYPANRAL